MSRWDMGQDKDGAMKMIQKMDNCSVHYQLISVAGENFIGTTD
jgi:hypothetical protein